MPIAAVAALVDLVHKGDREGALFAPGAPVGETQRRGNRRLQRDRARRSRQLQGEPGLHGRCGGGAARGSGGARSQEGGTAASIREVMDRTIDEVHRGTGATREAIARAADKLRGKQ